MVMYHIDSEFPAFAIVENRLQWALYRDSIVAWGLDPIKALGPKPMGSIRVRKQGGAPLPNATFRLIYKPRHIMKAHHCAIMFFHGLGILFYQH